MRITADRHDPLRAPYTNTLQRKLAWPQGFYPSIGGLRFLLPILRKHPNYPKLLQKLKSGATLMELGPGLGQDLRYLVDDGAPSDKMWAVDARPKL